MKINFTYLQSLYDCKKTDFLIFPNFHQKKPCSNLTEMGLILSHLEIDFQSRFRFRFRFLFRIYSSVQIIIFLSFHHSQLYTRGNESLINEGITPLPMFMCGVSNTAYIRNLWVFLYFFGGIRLLPFFGFTEAKFLTMQ